MLAPSRDYLRILLNQPQQAVEQFVIHWQPTYSDKDGSKWGQGWQHHIGTGVTYRF